MQLDERHAAKLRALAERTHVNPGTLGRSLLSMALDAAEPEPASIVALLDSIPGAFERAKLGEREIQEGKGIPLESSSRRRPVRIWINSSTLWTCRHTRVNG